jgi:hypothetical protein
MNWQLVVAENTAEAGKPVSCVAISYSPVQFLFSCRTAGTQLTVSSTLQTLLEPSARRVLLRLHLYGTQSHETPLWLVW